jgi:hypothetical protein
VHLPRERRGELPPDERVVHPVHPTEVDPDEQQGDGHTDYRGEEGVAVDPVHLADVEDVRERAHEEGPRREADEVNVEGDPRSPRDDAREVRARHSLCQSQVGGVGAACYEQADEGVPRDAKPPVFEAGGELERSVFGCHGFT